MRIRVIGPAAAAHLSVQDKESQFRRWARPDTKIEVVQCTKGPISIESIYDAVFAAPNVVKEVIRAEKEGADAAIISCFGDPGLHASREAVKIPVLGAGESAMLAAHTLGYSFSILVPIESSISSMQRNVDLYGFRSRLASIRALGIPVPELLGNKQALMDACVSSAQRCVEEDGADTILLGCGLLAGMADEIRSAVGVPVLDPKAAPVFYAEMYVTMKVGPSKRAFMTPPEKMIVL